MPELSTIHWAFMDRDTHVYLLGDRVAYSFTCSDVPHEHSIECLWIWHDCTMELDPERAARAVRVDDAIGWCPTGVGLHTLIEIDPLHIEASVYWPACCGLHGFIRNGAWQGV